MSEPRRDLGGLLRWYPVPWRDRYGDELTALMEDQLADRPPSVRFRLAMVVAGLRERAHGSGLIGRGSSPVDRARAGILIVLGAWAAFVVAGASYAKLSEHFSGSVPPVHRATPSGALEVVLSAAVVAGALFLIGLAAALPSVLRYLRTDGWSEVKSRVIAAVGASAIGLGTTAGLVHWAHALSATQRNRTDTAYGAAFVAWAVLMVAVVVLGSRAAIAVGRRLRLSRPVLGLESTLAAAIALAMGTMTVATSIWWASLAEHAPWFLHGTPSGTSGSAFDLRMVATMALMLAALVIAQYGVARIGRSWLELRRLPAD